MEVIEEPRLQRVLDQYFKDGDLARRELAEGHSVATPFAVYKEYDVPDIETLNALQLYDLHQQATNDDDRNNLRARIARLGVQ